MPHAHAYTFAVSHLAQATREAGAAATFAEKMKKAKYFDLAWMPHFVAVAVEAAGAMSSDALDFFADFSSQVRTSDQ